MDISFLQGSGIEALPQFLTSLALGLLIGLERERNPSAKAGLRTFALVAMFGTLAALLSTKLDTPWLLIAGLLTVAIMIIAAYLNDPGLKPDPPISRGGFARSRPFCCRSLEMGSREKLWDDDTVARTKTENLYKLWRMMIN
jgi:peptidoglycan/LPS O-acetylase OafA/YrhL